MDASRRFFLSKEQLLTDLLHAYKDACAHKRGTASQLDFEYAREDNLVALRDELWARTYRPRPSICFIIHDPKMREVFAADFRDRIVHHLFYNYTCELFNRTFVADSYSCIKGRGVHYGIKRLRHHLLSVSAGYSKPCYVLKIDISGYFMHINRSKLKWLCRATLAKAQQKHADQPGKLWSEVIDFNFVDYLLCTIIDADPLAGCIRKGDLSEWDDLPADKSIFHSPDGCGLPIGNLSSQLFSNVYMGAFDNWVKRELHCQNYGRYVDDAFIISCDRDWLRSLVPRISAFLKSELFLDLNPRKLTIADAYQGVEFLGAYIRPFRTYLSSSTLRRIRRKVLTASPANPHHLEASINSYLGVFSHTNSYRLRRVLFGYESRLTAYGHFSGDWLRFHI